jgi:glycosyltransferase involved in cell wall biosynthesis
VHCLELLAKSIFFLGTGSVLLSFNLDNYMREVRHSRSVRLSQFQNAILGRRPEGVSPTMRVCLVGITHPCHNPRLVREADTLVRIGGTVRVVAIGTEKWLEQRDERLLRSRGWQLERVDLPSDLWAGKLRSVWMRGRRRLASAAFQQLKWAKFADYSACTSLPELTRLASAQPADWVIAHTQPALPVAAAAAKHWNSRLGFDCEDLLSEMGDASCEAMRAIELRYLPQCQYVSVTSDCMAAHLMKTYAIARPAVLYNVFPVSLAKGLMPPLARPAYSPLRLHWFSQTLGIERGLQDILEACARLGERVELHLRGHASEERKSVILDFAHRCGVTKSIKFHPLIEHDEVVKSMGQYDVGLALERRDHPNYSRTVTNKVFSYLLAGLAIAATDTPGQREILDQVPTAGFLYPAGNSTVLAEKLRNWINNPGLLFTAKQASWDAARSKFCWDIEETKFLQLLGGLPNAVGNLEESTTR